LSFEHNIFRLSLLPPRPSPTRNATSFVFWTLFTAVVLPLYPASVGTGIAFCRPPHPYCLLSPFPFLFSYGLAALTFQCPNLPNAGLVSPSLLKKSSGQSPPELFFPFIHQETFPSEFGAQTHSVGQGLPPVTDGVQGSLALAIRDLSIYLPLHGKRKGGPSTPRYVAPRAFPPLFLKVRVP